VNKNIDILNYNRQAWNREVEMGNPWTVPVSREVIAAARGGELSLLLTPTRPVPRSWYPHLEGLSVLCLASGGGQQGPALAAAGAKVTVFDNSPRQLEQDRLVAVREGLELRLVQGDMADLSVFEDESFGMVFHPVSNIFAPDVRPVWREAYRVLRPGGVLLAGIVNPVQYIFDFDRMENEGLLDVRYSIPYSDLTSMEEDRLQKYLENGDPVEFGHSLEDQIGGQLDAGFLLAGFFEDIDPQSILSKFLPTFIATRAIRPLLDVV
jgi:SAM-dependent methyltransferase